METATQSTATVAPSSTRRIITILVGLAIIAGVSYGAYSYFTKGDDTPPSLTTKSALKGQFTESELGMLKFEASDAAGFVVSPGAVGAPLVSGVNYLYTFKETSIGEIVNSIDPAAKRVVIAYYSPGEGTRAKGYYTYPKGPYEGTVEIAAADINNFKIPAGRGVAVVAEAASKVYSLSAATAISTQTAMPIIGDNETGWVLVAANKAKASEALASYTGRVLSTWAQKNATEFEKVNDASTYTLTSNYLVWVKLDKKPTIVVNNTPTPTVTAIAPANGEQGKTVTVTITGTNLTGVTSVVIDPKAIASNIMVNAAGTTVTANVAIAADATVGAKTVTVVTPSGTIGAGSFEIKAPVPTSTVTAITPANGEQGKTVTVTITGTNLTGATAVNIDPKAPATGVMINTAGTTVTATVTIAVDAPVGAKTVTVVTPNGTVGAGSFEIKKPAIASKCDAVPAGKTNELSAMTIDYEKNGKEAYTGGPVKIAIVSPYAITTELIFKDGNKSIPANQISSKVDSQVLGCWTAYTWTPSPALSVGEHTISAQIPGTPATDATYQEAKLTVVNSDTVYKGPPAKITWVKPTSGEKITIDPAKPDYIQFKWTNPNKGKVDGKDVVFNYQWRILKGDYTGKSDEFAKTLEDKDSVFSVGWHEKAKFMKHADSGVCATTAEPIIWKCDYVIYTTIDFENMDSGTYTIGVEVGDGKAGSGYQLQKFTVENKKVAADNGAKAADALIKSLASNISLEPIFKNQDPKTGDTKIGLRVKTGAIGKSITGNFDLFAGFKVVKKSDNQEIMVINMKGENVGSTDFKFNYNNGAITTLGSGLKNTGIDNKYDAMETNMGDISLKFNDVEWNDLQINMYLYGETGGANDFGITSGEKPNIATISIPWSIPKPDLRMLFRGTASDNPAVSNEDNAIGSIHGEIIPIVWNAGPGTLPEKYGNSYKFVIKETNGDTGNTLTYETTAGTLGNDYNGSLYKTSLCANQNPMDCGAINATYLDMIRTIVDGKVTKGSGKLIGSQGFYFADGRSSKDTNSNYLAPNEARYFVYQTKMNIAAHSGGAGKKKTLIMDIVTDGTNIVEVDKNNNTQGMSRWGE